MAQLLRTNIAIRHKKTKAYLHPNGRGGYKMVTSETGIARFTEAAAETLISELKQSYPDDQFETVTLADNEQGSRPR